MTVVLSLKDVAVPGRLAPISLDVERGALHALTGANGTGKSTVLDCVLGLVDHAGTLQVEQGLTLAVVPQRLDASALLPVTVSELFVASRTWRPTWLGAGALEAELTRALELTGVSALAHRPLGALSGGELRRVLLADALASKPGLLLLDEPEAGLDDASRATLLTVLERLRAERATTLWVSHDAAAVQRLATHTTTLARAP